jgi:hypothetical protein
LLNTKTSSHLSPFLSPQGRGEACLPVGRDEGRKIQRGKEVNGYGSGKVFRYGEVGR